MNVGRSVETERRASKTSAQRKVYAILIQRTLRNCTSSVLRQSGSSQAGQMYDVRENNSERSVNLLVDDDRYFKRFPIRYIGSGPGHFEYWTLGRNEANVLIGRQMHRFCKVAKKTFNGSLMGEPFRRFGLSNDPDKESSDEDVNPKHVSWGLEVVWLSVGDGEGVAGLYYRRDGRYTSVSSIELYTFQQWG